MLQRKKENRNYVRVHVRTCENAYSPPSNQSARARREWRQKKFAAGAWIGTERPDSSTARGIDVWMVC